MKSLPAFLIVALLGSCGTEHRTYRIPAEKPGSGQGSDEWAEVKALTDQFCLRCHATSNFLKSESSFKTALVKSKLETRAMPLPGSPEAGRMTRADFDKMLSLF